MPSPGWRRPSLFAFALLIVPGSAGSTAATRAADCPPPPVTVKKLVNLDVPGQKCYGDTVLVFRAFVAPPCDECGGVSATVIAPRWLDGLLGSSANLSAVPDGPQLAAYVPPALGDLSAQRRLGLPVPPVSEPLRDDQRALRRARRPELPTTR